MIGLERDGEIEAVAPGAAGVDEHIYLHADEGGWSSDDDSNPASSADCDPGRRITVRRLDRDATVTISATITVSMSAPKRKTYSAAITVTPTA